MDKETLKKWKQAYKKQAEENLSKRRTNKNENNFAMLGDDEIGAANIDKSSGKTLYYLENIYIGDTGASCHMVHSNEGMYDVKNIKERITIGNGNHIMALKLERKEE